MKLPSRVKIIGLWYTIEAADDEMDVREAYGRTDYVNLTIKLDTKPALQKVKQTLAHEISHAANTILPFSERMSEIQVHALSQVQSQVFTENPEVRKFIFEDEE